MKLFSFCAHGLSVADNVRLDFQDMPDHDKPTKVVHRVVSMDFALTQKGRFNVHAKKISERGSKIEPHAKYSAES